mmetsp:Transcript_20399/g.26303  ORF Transcript_20399/g.26303 Transcript_20399/m.26303 type:complete len:174 (-) Transcript_20399:27-548(-)
MIQLSRKFRGLGNLTLLPSIRLVYWLVHSCLVNSLKHANGAAKVSDDPVFDVVSNNCVNIVMQMFCSIGVNPDKANFSWTVDQIVRGRPNQTNRDMITLLQDSRDLDMLALDQEESQDTNVRAPIFVQYYLENFDDGCIVKEENKTSSAVAGLQWKVCSAVVALPAIATLVQF